MSTCSTSISAISSFVRDFREPTRDPTRDMVPVLRVPVDLMLLPAKLLVVEAKPTAPPP